MEQREPTANCNVLESSVVVVTGNVQIWLGSAGVLVALFYLLVLSDRKRFRWFYLIGHILLASGTVALNVWIGIVLFVFWFIVAIQFYRQERKERSNTAL